jgi:hypothetical protein
MHAVKLSQMEIMPRAAGDISLSNIESFAFNFDTFICVSARGDFWSTWELKQVSRSGCAMKYVFTGRAPLQLQCKSAIGPSRKPTILQEIGWQA